MEVIAEVCGRSQQNNVQFATRGRFPSTQRIIHFKPDSVKWCLSRDAKKGIFTEEKNLSFATHP